jgi:hypothetical protein
MIYKQPSPVNGHVRVIFELPSCIWADKICLTGDFNHWEKSNLPMRQTRSGVWRIEIDLPSGTRHEFRYLIDGHWQTDYHADGNATNQYGTDNSVVFAELPPTVIACHESKGSFRAPSTMAGIHGEDERPPWMARPKLLPLADSAA